MCAIAVVILLVHKHQTLTKADMAVHHLLDY